NDHQALGTVRRVLQTEPTHWRVNSDARPEQERLRAPWIVQSQRTVDSERKVGCLVQHQMSPQDEYQKNLRREYRNLSPHCSAVVVQYQRMAGESQSRERCFAWMVPLNCPVALNVSRRLA